MNRTARELGRRGERLAERHYRRAGHRLIARNLRLGRREIDLLMLAPDGGTLVLIEVKTSSISVHNAHGALNRRKRSRIAGAARMLRAMGLLREHRLRVDGVLVDWSGPKPRIRVLEGPTVDRSAR